MDRRSEIKKMAGFMMAGMAIIIIILGIEAIYFDWEHGLYILIPAVAAKFLIGEYARKKLKRIDRDYPKEDKPSA